MAPVTYFMALTCFHTSTIPRKAGRTISSLRARPRPIRSSASATRPDCRRLPISMPSSRSSRSGVRRNFGIRQSLRSNMGRVFVAGSINMDVVATAGRHPKVGETVAGQAVHYFPGGKGANQAVAAAKLGATTALIGRLGTDAFGQQLRTFLAAQGVDLALVKDTPDIHTGTAIITVADADNTIVVVPGANACVSAEDVAAPILASGDVAVSQFEIPQATIGAFFKRARAAGATTILNPAPAIACGPELLDLVDILILNETELGFLAGITLADTDAPARFIEAARRLPTS